MPLCSRDIPYSVHPLTLIIWRVRFRGMRNESEAGSDKTRGEDPNICGAKV